MDASTFPIPFAFHLIFAIVAGVFFLLQFIRLKRPYQLIMAIAMPASLLIYIGDASNKSWFRTVGAFEAAMLIGAIVLAIMGHVRNRKAAQQPAVDNAGADTDETAADDSTEA